MEEEEITITTAQLNVNICKNLLHMISVMKLRLLEQHLILKVFLPQITKDNVMHLLNCAAAKLNNIRSTYRIEMQRVDISLEDCVDDMDVEEEEKSQNSQRNGSEFSSGSSIDNANFRRVEIPLDENEEIESIKQTEEAWETFNQYCIDMAALNLHYIMEKHQQQFLSIVKPSVLVNVISKAVFFYKGDPNFNNKPLVDILMSAKGASSVFDLLRLEKEEILKEDEQVRMKCKREPLLVWSVNSLTKQFYKQSDAINISGGNWRLALSYFTKGKESNLKVEIKNLNSPFDIKKNKDYFKKNEFSVPSNLDQQKIDPSAQFEVEQSVEDEQQYKIDQIDSAAQNYPNHSFVSFLASVDIKDNEEDANPPRIHSIICSQKAPSELLSIKGFDLDREVTSDTINVYLHFQMKQLHAQLLTYISKNFCFMMNDPDIKYLTKDDFKLLLKHKYFNVTQEDDVLKAICLWVQGQLLLQSKTHDDSHAQANIPYHFKQKLYPQDHGTLQHDLSEILANVNWDFVSLPCLLDIIRNQPLLSKNLVFRKFVKAQFEVRRDRSDLEAIENAKTGFNCEPRYSYKYNKSQRSLYPSLADISLQNESLVIAESGHVNQFQLIYPVQLYPDFDAHLFDCLLNPLDITTSVASLATSMPIEQNLGESANQIKLINKRSYGEEQTILRRRMLKHQIAMKENELKKLKDQLFAMDYLDTYKHDESSKRNKNDTMELIRSNNSTIFNIDRDAQRIEEAKRKFQMRVAKLEEKGGVRQRNIFNFQASEEESGEEMDDNVDESQNNGQFKNQFAFIEQQSLSQSNSQSRSPSNSQSNGSKSPNPSQDKNSLKNENIIKIHSEEQNNRPQISVSRLSSVISDDDKEKSVQILIQKPFIDDVKDKILDQDELDAFLLDNQEPSEMSLSSQQESCSNKDRGEINKVYMEEDEDDQVDALPKKIARESSMKLRMSGPLLSLITPKSKQLPQPIQEVEEEEKEAVIQNKSSSSLHQLVQESLLRQESKQSSQNQYVQKHSSKGIFFEYFFNGKNRSFHLQPIECERASSFNQSKDQLKVSSNENEQENSFNQLVRQQSKGSTRTNFSTSLAPVIESLVKDQSPNESKNVPHLKMIKMQEENQILLKQVIQEFQQRRTTTEQGCQVCLTNENQIDGCTQTTQSQAETSNAEIQAAPSGELKAEITMYLEVLPEKKSIKVTPSTRLPTQRQSSYLKTSEEILLATQKSRTTKPENKTQEEKISPSRERSSNDSFMTANEDISNILYFQSLAKHSGSQEDKFLYKPLKDIPEQPEQNQSIKEKRSCSKTSLSKRKATRDAQMSILSPQSLQGNSVKVNVNKNKLIVQNDRELEKQVSQQSLEVKDEEQGHHFKTQKEIIDVQKRLQIMRNQHINKSAMAQNEFAYYGPEQNSSDFLNSMYPQRVSDNLSQLPIHCAMNRYVPAPNSGMMDKYSDIYPVSESERSLATFNILSHLKQKPKQFKSVEEHSNEESKNSVPFKDQNTKQLDEDTNKILLEQQMRRKQRKQSSVKINIKEIQEQSENYYKNRL